VNGIVFNIFPFLNARLSSNPPESDSIVREKPESLLCLSAIGGFVKPGILADFNVRVKIKPQHRELFEDFFLR